MATRNGTNNGRNNHDDGPTTEPMSAIKPGGPDCRCGCGRKASYGAVYRPGHDGYHLKVLRRGIIDGTVKKSEARKQLSDALYAKLEQYLESDNRRR